MSRSWGHTLRLLQEGDKLVNYSTGCSASGCTNPITHVAEYDYVTGRRGRVSSARKRYCSGHAAKFAKEHGLEYVGPTPCDISKATRRPLIECVICHRKSRENHIWTVPEGITVYQRPDYNYQKRCWNELVALPSGAKVCDRHYACITADTAKQLGLERFIDERLPLAEVYSPTFLEALRERVNNRSRGL